MIYVIATIEVTAGKRAEFLAEFQPLVPLVRAEAGCVQYGPAVDVATTLPGHVPAREHVVTVLEQWESLEALERHLIAPHMLQYRARVKEKRLVAATSLRILQPA